LCLVYHNLGFVAYLLLIEIVFSDKLDDNDKKNKYDEMIDMCDESEYNKNIEAVRYTTECEKPLRFSRHIYRIGSI